jgi:hypothetical protein
VSSTPHYGLPCIVTTRARVALNRVEQARRGRTHDLCITMVRKASLGGATNRTFRVSRGSERSPDSESVRRELSTSGLGSKFDPHKCDFTGRGGGPLPEVLPVPSGMRCGRDGRHELCRIVVCLRTLHRTPGLLKSCRYCSCSQTALVRARAPKPLLLRGVHVDACYGGFNVSGTRF